MTIHGTSMLAHLLNAYDWFDHPEGMKFVETHQDAFRTVGHWLFLPGTISAFHRVLNCEEIWAIHLGRLRLHLIEPDGQYRSVPLGLDLAAGEVPVVTVPKGHWQAAELLEPVPFAFGANVCAPGFRYSEFQLGKRGELSALFPAHADLIGRLAHE